MKQVLFAFFFLFSLGGLFAQQTIYVKHDATGSNDGSSWQNAYTTVHAALGAASSGDQIWVAAGRYTADANTPNSSLILEAGVALYGGFNGTETMLSARNPTTNLTVLSGDLSGDDVVGNFAMNRSDNSIHVIDVVASAQPTDRAVVDGFTISGGNTTVGAANPLESRYGGGITTAALLTVSGCHFTDNNGEFGGGLSAADDAASGLMVDNCVFDKNTTSLLSAGIYIGGLLGGATIKSCTFQDNVTIRGCLYVTGSVGMVIDACTFENNTAGVNPCAGFYNWQTTFSLTNSTFKNNVASDYAAIYNDGRTDGFPFTIDKCLFEGNKATDTDAAASALCGGIFNAEPVGLIKNCVFKSNEADVGAAIYNSGASVSGMPLVIDSCQFETNVVSGTGSLGGGMYSTNAFYELRNSTFTDNSSGSRGGALYNTNTTFTLENTMLSGNISTSSGGGAMHNAGATVFNVRNCQFLDSRGTFGGAIGNYGDSAGGQEGTYEDCLFKGNISTSSGGVMNNGFSAHISLIDCTFEENQGSYGGAVSNQNELTVLDVSGSVFLNNIASNNGGAINLGTGPRVNARNAEFEGNSATFGGAVSTLGAGNIGNFNNCRFMSNTAATSGGALINGFQAYNLVDSCHFEANQARFGGGIFCQNDSTGIDIRNSTFSGNNADNNGGGVNIGSGIEFTVENTLFELNTSDRGAAMEVSEDSLDLAVATISNCTFQDNFAFAQGAGLNLSDADVTITNCLFARNQNFGDGAGGAISNNASLGKTAPVKIINSTFVENTATIGGGIAQWEDPAGADASVNLQNTILFNAPGGLDYEIEDGTPVVTSSGGNLSSDATLDFALTSTNDLTSSDPLFADASAFDYHLLPNSPCIDNGIAAGAPVLDLDGNPRQGPPDAGCFEWGTIATHIPGATVLPLKLMPNPTVERAVLVLENEWSGNARVQIVAQNGALVRSFTAAKTSGRWAQALDVRNLPAGVYSVQVLLGTAFHEGSLVKK